MNRMTFPRWLPALLLLVPARAWPADPAVMLRVTPGRQTGQMRVWIGDDGKEWRYVASSAPYLRAGTEVPRYLFPLPYLPAYVRVGVAGTHIGRIRIDAADAVVNGRPLAPLRIEPVGNVIDPANAAAADGAPAIVVHRGEQDAVDGLVLRFTPLAPPRPAGRRQFAYGVYEGAYPPIDKQAEWLSWFDFTLLTTSPGLVPLAREIRKISPNHRVTLRLMTPNNCVFDYFYDRASRDYIRYATVDAYLGPLADVTELVTISEEEPGNQMKGWFSTIPAGFVYEYRFEYEKETGRPFVWQSPDLVNWIGEKLEFMYDDLYGYIKTKYPKVKVYQWVELRGYGNMSGWPEFVRGEKIRMDGYVVEWSDAREERLVETSLGPAVRDAGYFETYVENLVAKKGLRRDQLLGQVWAHAPAGGDVVWQIGKVKEQEIRDIYVFVPFNTAGQRPPWVPEKDMEYGMAEWAKMKAYVDGERASGRKP